MTVHPIPPVWDKNSKILILGSFPSVKSREEGFFYGHRQNRFWRVVSRLFDSPLPEDIEEKKRLLLDNGVALWDVIASCEIKGSADSSIKNVTPNDFSEILCGAHIKAIFTNGKTASALFEKYISIEIGRHSICLPSTSPANAAWTLDRLISEWSVILEYLK